MSTVTSPIHREPELLRQTVVVIGGSAGIGFETARRARAEGSKVILTGRNAERLQHAASEGDALSTAGLDAAEEFVLACDLRFASRENTLLGQWEVGIGLVPGGGPMARLSRLSIRAR